jgi:hypothetical protein
LLDGVNRYVVHFNKDEIPPTMKNGFWSFTMYGSDFQLVKNPINRFSIGDRTKGLTYNPDGSLDIYIQNQAPGDTRAIGSLVRRADCSALITGSICQRKKPKTRRR